jgi:asparagine synthase (glutamine-hydrolysing)
MRRLSIIDLTGGWQPLFNEDRSIALVLNGEIYNFKELQAELRSRGHVLRTGSDAEVLIHLYEERGADAVLALRGAFAFALHDMRAGHPERVLLGRDRLGEKPLYLHESEAGIAFASELKAMLAGGVPFAIDLQAVDRYFHLTYAPEPATIIRGVRQLDAGSMMEIGIEPWTIREWRYWSMLDAPPLDGEPVQRIRDVLEEVATLLIRADVPVGVALSGGLDSSSVAALAVRAHGPGLEAFSVGYAGRPEYDERAQAAELAKVLGIRMHEVALTTDDMVREFPATVRERDEPIADIAGFGHRAVMRMAREAQVPVLLTGYGGDELFFGYEWARQSVAETNDKQVQADRDFPLTAYLAPRLPDGTTRRALRDWWRDRGGLRSSLARRARQTRAPRDRMVFYELADEYEAADRFGNTLYGAAILETVRDTGALWDYSDPRPRSDLAVTDRIFATYLRTIGLAQGDRLSMAQSVEARVPLVDYRLVETVIGLRKAGRGELEAPKAWLRAAMAGLLPDAVLRRPKRGFQPPIFEWHRALMRAYGRLLIDGALVRHKILSRSGAALLAAQELPAEGYHWLPFSALVLEIWCREMEAVAE